MGMLDDEYTGNDTTPQGSTNGVFGDFDMVAAPSLDDMLGMGYFSGRGPAPGDNATGRSYGLWNKVKEVIKQSLAPKNPSSVEKYDWAGYLEKAKTNPGLRNPGLLNKAYSWAADKAGNIGKKGAMAATFAASLAGPGAGLLTGAALNGLKGADSVLDGIVEETGMSYEDAAMAYGAMIAENRAGKGPGLAVDASGQMFEMSAEDGLAFAGEASGVAEGGNDDPSYWDSYGSGEGGAGLPGTDAGGTFGGLGGQTFPGITGDGGEALTFDDLQAGRFNVGDEARIDLSGISEEWKAFSDSYSDGFAKIRGQYDQDINNITPLNLNVGAKFGGAKIPMAPGKHVAVAGDKARMRGALLGEEAGVDSTGLSNRTSDILNRYKIGHTQYDDPIQEALDMESLDKQLANRLQIAEMQNEADETGFMDLIPPLAYVAGRFIT